MSDARQFDGSHAPAELIRRLPATFGLALNDQYRQWPLLFPAEQRQLRAQVDWLAHLPGEQFDPLFAPLLDVEKRMALPPAEPGATGLSVRDVGILARSPLYPRWRTEVERVFARVEDATETFARLNGLPRLVVCVLPPGTPSADAPLWPELSKDGAWLEVDRPFGETLPAFAAAIAGRNCPAELEEIERTWVFESDARIANLSGAHVLSWDSLGAIRTEFMRRLNTVRRDLRSVDQTSEELRRADIGRLLDPAMAANPRVREFVRTLFLSGNGSLLFGNSFVEWGASEALRRVQPQALIAAFGVRKKLKPFSSVVLFEDQTKSNPVADQDDAAGSLVDAEMLSQYVYLSAQRVSAYPGHTVTLMADCDSKRVLMIGTKIAKVDPNDLIGSCLRWLE
jgi:hypothetical protein